MNQKNSFYLAKIIQSILIVSFLNFSQPSSAETVLEKIHNTGVLKAGVRNDAVPFSYIDQQNNQFNGYSVELIKLIHQRLEQKLNKKIKLEFKEVSLDNRFQLIQDGTIDIVCAATTINNDREKIVDFSIPFFTTGIQLLVKKENAERFDPLKSTVGNISIGFLTGTTTDNEFRPIYPNADWQSLSNRAEGINQLENDELDAVVSDGILLLGEIWQQKKNQSDFQLIPKIPLTFENYGCILPLENPDWDKFIDTTITSDENSKLFSDWFDQERGKFPYQGLR